jgi:hypothetical protein
MRGGKEEEEEEEEQLTRANTVAACLTNYVGTTA